MDIKIVLQNDKSKDMHSEVENCRMVWIRRDLKDHLVQTPKCSRLDSTIAQ